MELLIKNIGLLTHLAKVNLSTLIVIQLITNNMNSKSLVASPLRICATILHKRKMIKMRQRMNSLINHHKFISQMIITTITISNKMSFTWQMI